MKKKTAFILLVLFISIFRISHTQEQPEQFPILRGPYLGQKPPGMKAERFAPEPLQSTNSWWWHGSPILSPDGNELYFSKYSTSGSNHIKINHMKMENLIWTAPQPKTFFASPEDNSNSPRFSWDGRKLFFWSGKIGGKIYFMNRLNNGWSEPKQLNIILPSSKKIEMQFSLTINEDVYFDVRDSNNNIDIYRALNESGSYSSPEKMGSSINTSHLEFSPYIAPDESYLIFSSNRPGGYGWTDLYICFKNPDGTWSEAKNMGNSINSEYDDAWPYVTKDGNIFFFVSKKDDDVNMNPYWVNAKIIESLKPEKIKSMRVTKTQHCMEK